MASVRRFFMTVTTWTMAYFQSLKLHRQRLTRSGWSVDPDSMDPAISSSAVNGACFPSSQVLQRVSTSRCNGGKFDNEQLEENIGGVLQTLMDTTGASNSQDS
jgi:hypothetical protein